MLLLVERRRTDFIIPSLYFLRLCRGLSLAKLSFSTFPYFQLRKKYHILIFSGKIYIYGKKNRNRRISADGAERFWRAGNVAADIQISPANVARQRRPRPRYNSQVEVWQRGEKVQRSGVHLFYRHGQREAEAYSNAVVSSFVIFSGRAMLRSPPATGAALQGGGGSATAKIFSTFQASKYKAVSFFILWLSKMRQKVTTAAVVLVVLPVKVIWMICELNFYVDFEDRE